MAFGSENIVKRTESIDYDNNKFIPVICSYDTEGKCIPLYFRHTYNNGESASIKIDRILFSKPNAVFGTIYCCEITSHEFKRIVYLYFHKDFNKWSLRKN